MSVSMRFVCVSEASQATTVEVLANSSDERITPFQLRKFAAGVQADSEGFYTMDDLRLLGRYLEALAAGRTTTQFLNQEYGDHAQDRPA